MGTSAVVFRDKGFWCEDGALEFWLYMLAHEIEKLGTKEQWLEQLHKHWRIQASGVGMGVIHTGLDEYLKNEEQVDQIITLNQEALTSLEEFGTYVPLEYLNKICPPDSPYLDKVPTESFQIVGEHFDSLLQGNLEVDTKYGKYGRKIKLTR